MIHWGGAAKAAPSRKRRQRSPDYEEEGEGEGAWIHPQEGHAGAVAFDGWMPPTPPRVASPTVQAEALDESREVEWKRCRGAFAHPQHPPLTRVAILPPRKMEGSAQLYTPWLRQLAHTGIATHIEKDVRGHIHLDACAVHPEANPLLSKALHSLAAHAYDAARAVLELELSRNPWAPEAWALLVHTELVAGCVDEARDRLATMRAEIASPEAWLLSADLDLYLNDRAAAVDHLLEALDQFPSEPALWLLLGSVWERRKQVNEAREAYARAIVGDCREPDDESLRSALARVGTCHGQTWLAPHSP
eukprot:m.442681 g.442681  ORF g.442681 m.442681 type:complete len:305 (+) comp18839_c0_seq1:190-1104(+)